METILLDKIRANAKVPTSHPISHLNEKVLLYDSYSIKLEEATITPDVQIST
jgi:hypothetical protein